jgi:hypothetical protein
MPMDVDFEIPIYYLSREEFDKRWDNKIVEEATEWAQYNGWDYEKAKDALRWNIYWPKTIWEYNKIIGYIVISHHGNTVYFDLWFSNRKKHNFLHFNTGNLTLCGPIPGTHFSMMPEWSNEDIIDNMNKWISFIEKECLRKSSYINREVFDRVIVHTDLRALFTS